ncbi:hypothetical protein ACX80W_13920 [Arthrobacter sp. TMN-37]
MSESSEPQERSHNEAPAEGDPAADPADLRQHTQDAAEGEDPDAGHGDAPAGQNS